MGLSDVQIKEIEKWHEQIINEFANKLFTILEWHTHIDCVADYESAERIREKFALNSIKWTNLNEDK